MIRLWSVLTACRVARTHSRMRPASATNAIRPSRRIGSVRSSEPRLASTAQRGRKGTDHERQTPHHTVVRSRRPAAVGWLCSRSRLLGRTWHRTMQSAAALCLAMRSSRLLDQQKWLRERRVQSASLRRFDELWSARRRLLGLRTMLSCRPRLRERELCLSVSLLLEHADRERFVGQRLLGVHGSESSSPRILCSAGLWLVPTELSVRPT